MDRPWIIGIELMRKAGRVLFLCWGSWWCSLPLLSSQGAYLTRKDISALTNIAVSCDRRSYKATKKRSDEVTKLLHQQSFIAAVPVVAGGSIHSLRR